MKVRAPSWAPRRALQPGDRVRSHYAAAWIGVVVERLPDARDGTPQIRVRMEVDRHGRPIRLRRSVDRAEAWYELVTP